MISAIDIPNWNTTSELRRKLFLNPVDSFPFNTCIGWKPERYKAGYDPARKPTANTIMMSAGTNHLSDCSVKPNCLPATWLKSGISKKASTIAITADSRVTKVDSVRNCAIKLPRADPNTFLTPTSLARFEERAVDRFIKLTQAINKIITAIKEKIYTYSLLPPLSSSYSLVDLWWIFNIGVSSAFR